MCARRRRRLCSETSVDVSEVAGGDVLYVVAAYLMLHVVREDEEEIDIRAGVVEGVEMGEEMAAGFKHQTNGAFVAERQSATLRIQ